MDSLTARLRERSKSSLETIFDEAAARIANLQATVDRLTMQRVDRILALEAALSAVMQWVDSPEVQAVFRKMGTLSITYKHLAIPISEEFSKKAAATLQAARAAMEEK